MLMTRHGILIGVALLCMSRAPAYCVSRQNGVSRQSLVLEDVYEIALGLPRIHFIIRKDYDGPPFADDIGFTPRSALVDTGVSAISISSRTASRLGFKIEPQARYIDMGVGGEEVFRVSEPLILGLAGFHIENPADVSNYRYLQQARFKIRQGSIGLPGGPQDTIGMPAMTGRVVVLDTGSQHASGHVPVDIRPAGALDLPECEFAFRLRMQDFNYGQDKRDIPPLPTLAANPMIDEVVLEHQGKMSTATWLLDTGSKISLISTQQARRLGLLDAEGKPRIKPIMVLPVGGVGSMTMLPMYRIDRLLIPEVSGRRIIYAQTCVGVLDITYPDPETQASRVFDGIFGSNLLCAAQRLPGLHPAGAKSVPFDKVVIDFSRKQVGLQLKQK